MVEALLDFIMESLIVPLSLQVYANEAGKPCQIVANFWGCKFCHLSLYSDPSGCKMDLGLLFSNYGGCKWVKIVKKQS